MQWFLRGAALLLLFCFGCEEGPIPEVEPRDHVATYPDVEPGPVLLRRLSSKQLENSLLDIFGADVVVPEIIEPDVAISGLISVGSGETTWSPRGSESVELAAYAVAEQAMASPQWRSAHVPCEPSMARNDACAEVVISVIGSRLWRRPLKATEQEGLVEIAGAAADTLESFDGGIEFGLAALIQSPFFLFRVEQGYRGEDGLQVFSEFDLASRLSYFLWNTTPDDELLRAAEAGELSSESGLRVQATRLLSSPRARHGVRSFFRDYLGLYELDHLQKDPGVFEHFKTDLGREAAEETLLMLERIVWDLDGDIRDMMTTRETFISPILAAIYGAPAPSFDGFSPVTWSDESERAGLLGQISFLSAHAHRVSSSASLRGKAVRLILLCQSVPNPPVNVDTSIPEPSGTTRTLRERVAEHLTDPSCAGCHAFLDPIGLALENFDGIGRWRDTDNGAEIDASGDLDGVFFESAIGLGKAVREHPNFAPCIVKTMTRYALGRTEVPSEKALLDVLERRFERSGFKIQTLLLDLVLSPLFRRAGLPKEVE